MNVTILPVGMLGTNCYILASEAKSCAIIDPGAQPDKIAKAVEDAGLTPRYLLLTHGHHDHIGGVKELMARFPEMELFIGEKDEEMLLDGTKSLASIRNTTPDEFLIEGSGTLTDGQELTLDELTVKVVETPGHTRGGVCYLCRDAMFSGDTLFRGDIGRCDLYGGDFEVMKQSLQKLAALEGDYAVYPGHGPSTTLEHERKHNPYINQR